MKLFLLSVCLVAAAQCATILKPADCKTYPCLIFEDEFDFLDHDAWEHEVTMSGGGNWEFEAYLNNRSISYTRESTLFIKPDLVANWKNEDFLSTGDLNLWGMNGRGDVCTGNSYYGCERLGQGANIINPIMSARIRTLGSFDFKYGRMEVRAKMPKGNWLWPAIWLLPKNWPYGLWPASGEIDLVESRGNANFGTLGNQYGGSTLHWGPYWPHNRYDLTTVQYEASPSFAADFHVWAMEWTNTTMKFYLDDVLQMTVDPGTNFWDYGGFSSLGDIDNIWEDEGKMAPFNQKFYIVMNLAVGGTNGFFPDGIDPAKPWSNESPQALLDFWNGRGEWYPTWSEDGTMLTKVSENAALQVDYVKVYKMTPDATR